MIFYTNWFVPKGFAAITLGPFIFIRPTRKGDVGLVEHEKVHVKQFWKSCGLFWVFYLLSKKARFKYEVEAYKVQAVYNPEKIEMYADALATKYKIGVTKEEALQALKG